MLRVCKLYQFFHILPVVQLPPCSGAHPIAIGNAQTPQAASVLVSASNGTIDYDF